MSNLSVSEIVAAAIAASIIPATVAAKVQGESLVMDVASFHPDTLSYIFTYGARRLMQDHVNAQAAAFNKAKDDAAAKGETFKGEFDALAVINARLAAFESGNLSARTSGSSETFTEFDNAVYDAAVSAKGAAGWKELAMVWTLSKGMTTADRKAEMLKAVESLDDKRKAAIHRAAKVRLDAANALRDLDIGM